MSGTDKTFYFILGVVMLFVFALSFCRFEARAHDLPYTITPEPEWVADDCCHGRDCYPTPYKGGEVVIIEGGYSIWVEGKPAAFYPFDDARIRLTNPTDDFYICRSYRNKGLIPHCLYPPRAGS